MRALGSVFQPPGKASSSPRITALPGSQLRKKLVGRHGGERCRGLAAGGGVALKLVFEHKLDAAAAHGFGGLLQFGVDGLAEGSGVFKTPKVEAADLVGFEAFGLRDAALGDLVLLLEGVVGGVVHVGGAAVLRLGRAGPVDFIERATRMSVTVSEYFARMRSASASSASESACRFLPHKRAELDEAHAEVAARRRSRRDRSPLRFRR